MAQLADRFFEAAEAFFRKTAVSHGLGIGVNGKHQTVTHGSARALTLFGWKGQCSFAVIFGIPDVWQLTGRGYLLWCIQSAGIDPDPNKLPAPAGEQIVFSPEELERALVRGLRWLESHTFAEVQASFFTECLAGEAPRGQS